MKPAVCIGMFLYNEEAYAPYAIQSLLKQSYRDFTFLILDDCSTDQTPAIVQRFAKKDKRISYIRNNRCCGYIHNYGKTFVLAPVNTAYFAWAAGHDLYHPRWLETMVKTLATHPDAVMSYSAIVRIDANGKRLQVPSTYFDTKDQTLDARIESVTRNGVGFGNMIYGLFRASAIRKAGIFPRLLLPDVYLLTKLALLGTFVQVHKELWYRRFDIPFSIDRQRRVAFGSSIPWYSYLPWPLVNSLQLFWETRAMSGGTQLSKKFFLRFWPKMKRDNKIVGRYILVPLLRFLGY